MTQPDVIYHFTASLSTHSEESVQSGSPNIELRGELNLKLLQGGTKNKKKKATDDGGI